ncbi:MAG: hypothetical protein LBQ47_08755, partial [Endomicrobium sp.]|nr:hypothetical protein [Endomicrobium sp.]
MKRILALAASLAVFATSSFAADGLSLSNVKLFGEGSIYAVYDGKGNGGIQSDVLLGLSVAAYENVKLSLAAGYVGTWGENGITGGELDNSSNSGYINKIKIVLANIEISKLFGVDSLSAVIGRQFYGKEDSTAVYFGVRRYQDLTDTLITSADALSLNYNKDNIEASAIYASLDTAPTRNVLVG